MTTAHVPVLEGERIRLRPHREADRDPIFELYSEPRVTRYWSYPSWTELAQADAYLAPVLPSAAVAGDAATTYPWAIAERDSDRLIGTATIFALRRAQHLGDVGYSLMPAHQGRGLAREALTLAIDYAFAVLAVRRLEADVDPRNTASWGLLERLGFRREGLLRERWLVNDELCDTAFYGLLRAEFRR